VKDYTAKSRLPYPEPLSCYRGAAPNSIACGHFPCQFAATIIDPNINLRMGADSLLLEQRRIIIFFAAALARRPVVWIRDTLWNCGLRVSEGIELLLHPSDLPFQLADTPQRLRIWSARLPVICTVGRVIGALCTIGWAGDCRGAGSIRIVISVSRLAAERRLAGAQTGFHDESPSVAANQ